MNQKSKTSSLETFKTVLLLVTAVWLVVTTCDRKAAATIPPDQTTAATPADATGMKELRYYRALPGNNYLGQTLNGPEIAILRKAGVRTIVRLNGDTQADRGDLSIQAEADLCEQLGIRFYYLNIEGSIEQSGEVVANLMSTGNTFVHCRNGQHRAPAMAAAYLRRLDVPRSTIVLLVGWQKLAMNPGKYEKYTVVLPVQ
jgi:hypothetical protein